MLKGARQGIAGDSGLIIRLVVQVPPIINYVAGPKTS